MVELLSQIEEEGLVCQLLDLIDKLNNTFIRYTEVLIRILKHYVIKVSNVIVDVLQTSLIVVKALK